MQLKGDNASTNAVPRPVSFRVSPDLPVFAGHFPGMPLVPAALELEWMLAALPGGDADGWTVRLGKFSLPLLPGDEAEIRVQEKNGAYGVTLASVRGIHASATFEAPTR